eukprot:TRINITY_DN7193_c0_g1_i12.p1 TRINITY_DN7193_c0_g1~~TRINITY_DN7193_c0_g1_i12.p1  ORF type:complete len:444 (-),score=95.56 TRINITY_DN7193_c0_g1_i12:2820-4151(-)
MEITATDAAHSVGQWFDTMVPVGTAWCSAMVTSVRSAMNPVKFRAATTGPTAAERMSYKWGHNAYNNRTAYYGHSDTGVGGAMIMVNSIPEDATERQNIENYVQAAGAGGMGVWVNTDDYGGGETANFQRAWPAIKSVYWSGGDDFTRSFPFYDFSQLKMPMHVLDVEIFKKANQTNNPSHEPVWTTPYVDLLTSTWILSLFVPVFDIMFTGDKTLESGLCGFDLSFTTTILYMDTLSETLPWGAYAILVTNTGQIVAIPNKGSDDWSDDSDFSFSNASLSTDFNASVWNIFTNPDFFAIGEPIEKGLALNETADSSLIHFGGGRRSISWCSVEGTGWVVVAVFDSDKALSSQHRQYIAVIAAVAALGCVVGVFTLSAAIYTALRRQYAGMENRIQDLSVKLADAERRAANNTTGLPDLDAMSVNALSTGIEKVRHTNVPESQ